MVNDSNKESSQWSWNLHELCYINYTGVMELSDQRNRTKNSGTIALAWGHIATKVTQVILPLDGIGLPTSCIWDHLPWECWILAWGDFLGFTNRFARAQVHEGMGNFALCGAEPGGWMGTRYCRRVAPWCHPVVLSHSSHKIHLLHAHGVLMPVQLQMSL